MHPDYFNTKKQIDSGQNIREMAEFFGLTNTPMRYWLKKLELKEYYDSVHNKRTWTDEELIESAETSFTMADVLRKLNLTVRPGNYNTVNRHIVRLKLSTDHFTGKSHGTSNNTKYTLDECLVENSTVSRGTLKRKLIKEGVLENRCSVCNISEWNGKEIVMVLDHINGTNNDNRLKNLRMLCPNCNSQQTTFCRK